MTPCTGIEGGLQYDDKKQITFEVVRPRVVQWQLLYLGTLNLQVGSTGVTMRSQKEITLRNDLDAKDRTDIYRNFLLYCMSGDVVALPMGSTGAAACRGPAVSWYT